MKIKGFLILGLCSSVLYAQAINQKSTGNNSPNIADATVAPAPPAPLANEITVKSSPAEDALMQSAAKLESTNKAYNDLFNQARVNLDTLNKPILDQMAARAKKWQDKIDAENKDLKNQLLKNQADAQEKFQKEVAALSAQAVSPQTITALEAVVKEEQNLPKTAHFDSVLKKWVDTAKK